MDDLFDHRDNEIAKLKAKVKRLKSANKKQRSKTKNRGMTMNEIRAKFFPNMTDEDWEKRYEPVETVVSS
jgi:hypothetical protein